MMEKLGNFSGLIDGLIGLYMLGMVSMAQFLIRDYEDDEKNKGF